MKKHIIILIIFILIKIGYSQVFINEVLYDPTGTDTGLEWIELKNIGVSTVLLTDYCLYASSEHYIFSTFSLNPGALVVIHWNASGTDNATDLYTGTTGWSNMGNTSGSVVLFNTHSTHSSSTIIDYLEYGAGSQTYESSATGAGIWTAGDFISDVAESHSIEYDGSGDSSSDWFDQSIPTQGNDNSLPVELTSFTTEEFNGGILLKWITESEIENLGFFIERKTNGTDWQEIVSYKTDKSLLGQGSSSVPSNYEYFDNLVESSKTYEYRLADINYDNVVTYHATRIVFIGNNPMPSITDEFKVLSYPNPFNPSTTIRYNVPNDNSIVKIAIYNISGELVNTLVDGEQLYGWHEIQWCGTNQNVEKVPGGVYLCKIRVGNEVKTSKLLLLK